MKQAHYKWWLVACTCLALSACRFPGSGGGKAPTGQVLATVDGQEITMRDLTAELGGTTSNDPKQRKALEQQALQSIVNRKLLAKAAEEQGLQKTPEFALQKQRLTDTLLAQSLQNKLVSAVPAPTREEADAFMASHPDIFGQRKLFTIEQIQARGPMNEAAVHAFEPMKTLDEVQAALARDHVDYRRGTVTQDAVGMDPRLVDVLVKLPPNEVLIVPRGAVVEFGVVRETKVQPFQGQAAVNYATQLLRQQRTQEAVSRQMQGVLAKGATTVSYNPVYKPAATAAAGAPSKPAS